MTSLSSATTGSDGFIGTPKNPANVERGRGVPASVESGGGERSLRMAVSREPKVARRRRGESAKPVVSVWAQYRIWWSPFLAEVLLFVAALLLTIYLHQVVGSSEAAFPLWPFAGLGCAYLGLASHNRLNELYLPRPVVFFGVGSLMAVSLLVMGWFLTGAYLDGGYRHILYEILALVPMLVLLGRCALLFLDARRTPPISALAMKANVKTSKFRDFRRKLRFWMT